MNKLINNSICRSCLGKKQELIDPHTECDPINKLNYDKEYYLCTNIIINETESLPMMLCQDCISELQIAYQFQHRAKQSNDILLKCSNGINKNFKPDVLIHNKATMRVQAEHGYSFIGITTIPVSSETSRLKNEWNCSEEINLKMTNKNEYVISMDDTPDSITNESTDAIKYSILEIDGNEEFTFNCAKCNERFASNVLLEDHFIQTHMLTEARIVELRCTECNEIFSSELELNEHIKTEHLSIENCLCRICGENFVDLANLDEHLMSTHQDQQELIQEDNAEYDESDLIKKKTKVLKYLCSICGKNFTTNQRLRIHTYTHTGERNYDCDLCSKKFATEFRLRSHHRTHTGERPYECSICKLRFAQANALKCHKRIHTGEKPYECRYCSKKFSQNTILKTHMTLHTGKTIQCPDCDKKFSRASFLILHRREHTGEKPYACDRCPNRYKQKNHLDRHMDIHNGVKYKCTICNKEYSKQYSLKMHMFTHTNEKPFNCPHCTATFIRNDRYKSHLKLRHMDANE